MSSINRGDRIFQYILANPGCHLRQIKKALELNMGVTQWYLNKMERKGQIWSVRKGIGPLGLRKFWAKEKIRVIE